MPFNNRSAAQNELRAPSAFPGRGSAWKKNEPFPKFPFLPPPTPSENSPSWKNARTGKEGKGRGGWGRGGGGFGKKRGWGVAEELKKKKKGLWVRAAKAALRGRKLKACELFLNRDWSHMVINHWDIYSAIHKVIAYLSPAYLSL